MPGPQSGGVHHNSAEGGPAETAPATIPQARRDTKRPHRTELSNVEASETLVREELDFIPAGSRLGTKLTEMLEQGKKREGVPDETPKTGLDFKPTGSSVEKTVTAKSASRNRHRRRGRNVRAAGAGLKLN